MTGNRDRIRCASTATRHHHHHPVAEAILHCQDDGERGIWRRNRGRIIHQAHLFRTGAGGFGRTRSLSRGQGKAGPTKQRPGLDTHRGCQRCASSASMVSWFRWIRPDGGIRRARPGNRERIDLLPSLGLAWRGPIGTPDSLDGAQGEEREGGRCGEAMGGGCGRKALEKSACITGRTVASLRCLRLPRYRPVRTKRHIKSTATTVASCSRGKELHACAAPDDPKTNHLAHATKPKGAMPMLTRPRSVSPCVLCTGGHLDHAIASKSEGSIRERKYRAYSLADQGKPGVRALIRRLRPRRGECDRFEIVRGLWRISIRDDASYVKLTG